MASTCAARLRHKETAQIKKMPTLIPVSAIGRKFATMDDEGRMVKNKAGRLRPVNVEIPLCAVLPDLFAQIQEQLDQADEDRLMAERRARARLTGRESVAAVGKFLALPAGAALRIRMVGDELTLNPRWR